MFCSNVQFRVQITSAFNRLEISARTTLTKATLNTSLCLSTVTCDTFPSNHDYLVSLYLSLLLSSFTSWKCQPFRPVPFPVVVSTWLCVAPFPLKLFPPLPSLPVSTVSFGLPTCAGILQINPPGLLSRQRIPQFQN